MKRLVFLLLCLCCCGFLYAQCPNFTNLSAAGVTCNYGYYWSPYMFTGIASGRHTVITQQGYDSNTGNQLPYLPPGENAVVKLGNTGVSSGAEAITYQFTVDPERAILLVKFAVVMRHSDYFFSNLPRFVIRILDTNGQLVEECAEYDVTAEGNTPGFQTYGTGSYRVHWRPWTNVGFDLSDYAGQTVRVQFVTRDCAISNGEYGYAYFTASCIRNRLALLACNGNQMKLSAPEGFDSYQWDNGSTGSTATYTANGVTSANCLITSVTGCRFTLSATLSNDVSIPTVSSTIYDKICEGDSYQRHYFNLSPQYYESGTHPYYNTFFNSKTCDEEGVTTTLYLTVKPRYYHIHDVACQGRNYNSYGFHISNLPLGELSDTTSSTSIEGCDSITILHLLVYPSVSLPVNVITGETSVCRGEIYRYELPNTEGLANFQWILPAGVNILCGQRTSSVNLYFTDEAPNPATIRLYAYNNCDSKILSLKVKHYPSYQFLFQDTICLGSAYYNHGFNLISPDSVGLYSYTITYSTAQGCDSVHILHLLVTDVPTLTTLAQPSEICSGQSSSISVSVQIADSFQVVHTPPIAVGDILCDDNSIVKPSEWPVEDRTAQGIVFYVDTTGEHGWVVHLHDQDTCAWGNNNTNIQALPNYYYPNAADMDGYVNTQLIRAAGTAADYPAAYAMDFANGWYLPTAGQLRLLFAENAAINASLQLVGGTPVLIDWDQNEYWSSTEALSSSALEVGYSGMVSTRNKGMALKVRGIRDFYRTIVENPPYRIGDVYTAPDGRQGIVFYLHPDGSGGWVVALNDASDGCAWGNNTNVPLLLDQPNDMYLWHVRTDTAGYDHTRVIREYQNNNNSYAAGRVDFDNGWVLPAPAQLSMLFAQMPFIGTAITNAGGATLSGDYWCSAEVNTSSAWCVRFSDGPICTRSKSTLCKVREVRSFSNIEEVHDTLMYQWGYTDSTQSSVEVSPTQSTTYTVTVTTGFGCSQTATVELHVNPPSSSIDTHTVCDSFTWIDGNTYTESTNTPTYTLTNAEGCDSLVILHLLVAGIPDVNVIVSDDEICEGDTVTLSVNVPSPHITVGDIFCIDGSAEKPSVWPVEGKMAIGVVFYVDNTGEHGWAVSLRDTGEFIWGIDNDIPTMSNYDFGRDAISDLDGYTNTKHIRESGNASLYPAAYAVDFSKGWYLPAEGQLRLLYGQLPTINASLKRVEGAQPLATGKDPFYWSSTETNSNSVWSIRCVDGAVYSNQKSATSVTVRAVRSF